MHFSFFAYHDFALTKVE